MPLGAKPMLDDCVNSCDCITMFNSSRHNWDNLLATTVTGDLHDAASLAAFQGSCCEVRHLGIQAAWKAHSPAIEAQPWRQGVPRIPTMVGCRYAPYLALPESDGFRAVCHWIHRPPLRELRTSLVSNLEPSNDQHKKIRGVRKTGVLKDDCG